MDHRRERPMLFLRFAACFAIIAALLSACVQEPNGEDNADGAVSPIAHPTLEEVTAEEAAQAEAALRETGVIERINGGQPWEMGVYTTSRAGTKKIGVIMNATWETPVTSDGPWLLLRCRDTQEVEGPFTWHNLTAVAVIVSLDNHEILSLTPPGLSNPAHRDATPEGPTPYPDPDEREKRAPLPDCPPGLNDD
jgi:hypothetical protein